MLDCAFPAQFAFSVPKKLFPNATDRNRLKRLMRESVRQQKPELYTALTNIETNVTLLFCYQNRQLNDQATVDGAILETLQKLLQVINRN